jgi:hypothetical protein
MARFILIDVNDNFHLDLIKNYLTPYNYTEIDGGTGGDNDFLCVDTQNKEWCWCEHGFAPFHEYTLLEYRNDENITLSELVDMRLR